MTKDCSMFIKNSIVIFTSSENVWDSQQNSQAWGFSQNSNSQIVPGSSSQNSFKYSSEFSRRQNSSSVNSDYWSQSQNISQPLPEVIFHCIYVFEVLFLCFAFTHNYHKWPCYTASMYIPNSKEKMFYNSLIGNSHICLLNLALNCNQRQIFESPIGKTE